MSKLTREAESLGYVLVRKGKKHIIYQHRKTGLRITLPHSPGSTRIKNYIAKARARNG